MATFTSNISVTQKQLDALLKTVDDNVNTIVQATAGELLDDLTDKPNGDFSTPRDTLRATNGWNVAAGHSPDLSDGGRALYPEPGDGKAMAKRAIAKGAQKASVANGVPYIVDLNNGTSTQAPAGFVDKAVVHALKFLDGINITRRNSGRLG